MGFAKDCVSPWWAYGRGKKKYFSTKAEAEEWEAMHKIEKGEVTLEFISQQRRKSGERKEKIANEFASHQKGKTDPNFWTPTLDKECNGYAVIRFLPEIDDEDLPYIRYWDHFFRGSTGKVYSEKSLSTLDRPDPVFELNSELWNSSSDDDSLQRKQARRRKRNQHFVSNILVIQDPVKPECEGCVFTYKYGKTIFDKLVALLNPKEEFGGKAIDPFDIEEGVNFIMKVKGAKQPDGKFMPQYDDCSFSEPCAMAGKRDEKGFVTVPDEAMMKAILGKRYTLADLISEDKFKTYDELMRKLKEVLDVRHSPSVEARAAESRERPAARQEEDETTDRRVANKARESAASQPMDEADEAMAAFQKYTDQD